VSAYENSIPTPAALAAQVQSFYERYPYPPPSDDLDRYRQRWQEQQRRRADFHLFWPGKTYHEDYSILVAGCGTSQAAKYAVRWPAARVTGIDFSETSVRHTAQLKDRHRLDNLEVRQLPLERAADLGTSFDQIVCTGVLHHLADPDAGLSALRSVLKSDGAMHLMVYAPYGRTGVYMLQEFCRRIGIPATDSGIRDLIVALRSLPAGHPLERLLRESPDFRSESALADALLHPQDHAYSVPEFLAFLARSGLTFARWVRQAPYSLQCGVMARIGTTLPIGRLAPRDQWAAAELFRGTMLRHSAVVCREDNPLSPGINFAGAEWLCYVPIRTADTLAVRERLPPGSAAVLINRAHTHTDIYLPVDASEWQLLQSVDGKRTIGELLPLHAAPDAARAFFERLWWHDQIVFDTSQGVREPLRSL
jgi:SAM-dependent methyltransferase